MRFSPFTSLAVAVVVATVSSSSVRAFDVAGVNVAEKATVGGQSLVLNGAGLRTKVVFKVYIASLYTPAKATTTAAVLGGARRVELRMMRSLTADTLVEALDEGLKANSSDAELTAAKAGLDALRTQMKALGELKEGTTIDLDFVSGTTTILLNGAKRGEVAGDAVNVALMKVWLGNKPVQDDLKEHLLGRL
jgi:hypothetical protein